MENQYAIKANNTKMTTTTTISPTTFVQADLNTFKDLVQKLTGSSGDSADKLPVTLSPRQPKPANLSVDPTGPRRSPFKLQDRRQMMRKLEIKLSLATIGRGGAPPSPSSKLRRWFDSPAPSPVTPLCSESQFVMNSSSGSPSPAESPAGERGFYLFPSPLSTPRGSDPPELLNLFPLTSPRVNVAEKHNRD